MDFVRYMTRVYYICTIIVHYYNMKNNYSKRLMDVIEYSREEAARLQNSYIGPEHLMLGIIRDGEGKAVQALRELNVDEWDIKRKIEQEIKNTIDAEDAVQHDIAISKTTERVLRMSMLESRLFKKKETGTEHLLLAILKEEFNVAAKVLNEAGITYRSIYNYLISGTGLKHMDDFIGKEDAEHFEGISDGYTDDDEDDDDEDEEDYEFEPRISPSNATNQTLKWTSSNKKVVKVDEDGYVYIVDAGKAVITAMATDGSGVKAKCTVTVIDDADTDDEDDDE